MEINRNNYESWFVDYLDGNLDEKLVDDFIEFLRQNPDLKEELSFFGTVSNENEDITFPKKEKLYKEIYDTVPEFNRAAIARLEGDLTETEKTGFEIYLVKHPEKQKEAALFSKTKLTADKSIVFNKKDKLYHNPAGKTIVFWSVRIAAVVIFAIVFYVLYDRPGNNNPDGNKLAQVNKESPKTEDRTNTEQTKQIPLKTEEKKDSIPAEKNSNGKTEIKDSEPKTKPAKSLRENNKGRIETDDLVKERVPVTIPEKMGSLTASLVIPEQQVSLAAINLKPAETEYPVNDERLLADVVKEKTGLENLSFDKIKKAGLNLVSGFTKENFSYETNSEGQITEINYESRLLAFTIPTRNEKEGR